VITKKYKYNINSEIRIQTNRYPVGAGSLFGDSPHRVRINPKIDTKLNTELKVYLK
jgi:hypothetical protein